MLKFKTFVFFDIEATGLPDLEFNRTKITELALVACSKVELEKYAKGKMPRVLHKLTICVNPRKVIQLDSSKITGENFSMPNWSSHVNGFFLFIIRTRQLQLGNGEIL